MESEVFSGRSSYRNYLLSLSVAALGGLLGILVSFDPASRGVGMFLLAISAGIVGERALRVMGSAYHVTSERVSCRNGIISRRVSEVEVSDIRNVQVDQGILQRILGIGDIGVSTAGQSGMEISFQGLKNPAAVAELIRAQRKAATSS